MYFERSNSQEELLFLKSAEDLLARRVGFLETDFEGIFSNFSENSELIIDTEEVSTHISSVAYDKIKVRRISFTDLFGQKISIGKIDYLDKRKKQPLLVEYSMLDNVLDENMQSLGMDVNVRMQGSKKYSYTSSEIEKDGEFYIFNHSKEKFINTIGRSDIRRERISDKFEIIEVCEKNILNLKKNLEKRNVNSKISFRKITNGKPRK